MNIYIIVSVVLIAVLLAFVFVFRKKNPPPPLRQEKTQRQLYRQAPKEDQLNKYFKPAPEKVATDYPTKKIGECPYSKPLSSDIPIGNVPMYFAESSDNMRLI